MRMRLFLVFMSFRKCINKLNLIFTYLKEKRTFIWDYRWQFLVIQIMPDIEGIWLSKKRIISTLYEQNSFVPQNRNLIT